MNYNKPNVRNVLKLDYDTAYSISETDINVINNVLTSLNLKYAITDITPTPAITSYHLQMFDTAFVPKTGRIEKALRTMLANGNIKVDTSKGFVIQIPNKDRHTIGLADVIGNAKVKASALPLFIGIDENGNGLFYDLAKTPHMLIGGTTGSGKSVCVNSIIASLLLFLGPKHLELTLIDPKFVEFAKYNGLPHLAEPVITEVDNAITVLNNAVCEMERRYKIFEDSGYKSIDDYPHLMKYKVIIIDELADLMLQGGNAIKEPLTRLLQKSRAAGIHIILATQNPIAKVIPNIIKANCPTRIAFKTASITDSRVILDYGGADKLLGYGDGLLKAVDNPNFVRFQGAYISDTELEKIINHWKAEANRIQEEQERELQKQAESESEPKHKKSIFKRIFRGKKTA